MRKLIGMLVLLAAVAAFTAPAAYAGGDCSSSKHSSPVSS